MGGDTGLSGVRKDNSAGIVIPNTGTVVYGQITGADAYVMGSPSGSTPVTAYVGGGLYGILPDDPNGGIATLNISGVGAKDLVRYDSAGLEAGDLPADIFTYFVFNDIEDHFSAVAPVASEIAVNSEYTDGGESRGKNRILGNIDNFDLSLITNNSTRLFIDNGGNIGINEAVPDEKLHIVGNLKIEGQAWEDIQATLTPGATTQTIDWDDGNLAVIDLAAASGDVTLTLNNPNAGGFYFVKIIQDASSGLDIVWPGSVLWPGGTTPVISAGASAVDTISLAYDGASYYATIAQNFS